MEKTKVVSLTSIKGGVGKTHIVILLADAISTTGKRVLLVDSDLNNSLSFHYLSAEAMEQTRKKNFAAALGDEQNNLCDFAVHTKKAGIDLIASSPYLSDLRTINEKRLATSMSPRVFATRKLCHWWWRHIRVPRAGRGFACRFRMRVPVLARDVESLKNWLILLNGYNKRFEDAKTGRQSDFIDMYTKSGFPLTPQETWMPWSQAVHQIVDHDKMLSGREGIPGSICVSALYDAVCALAGGFFDEPLAIAEAF